MPVQKDTQFDHLRSLFDEDKLHHCYIFAGESGCGQGYTIDKLSRYIFCSAPERPCGECTVCRRVSDGSFSDIKTTDALVTVDKLPKIDEIRDIISWSYTSPMEGKHKLVIIHNIDQLNIRAINLLLKTIEEPPEQTYFILTAKDKQSVLPTILSRAMLIHFSPVRDSDDEILSLANGRWELAQRLASDSGAVESLKQSKVAIMKILADITSRSIPDIFAISSKVSGSSSFVSDIWLNLYESAVLNSKEIDTLHKIRIIDHVISAREQKKSYCRDVAVIDSLLINSFAVLRS